MARQYCEACDYPIKVCICQAISTIDDCPYISILQHPKEAGHSKNTAKLIELVVPNASIHVGHSPTDFIHAQERTIELKTVVIYPADISVPIESVPNKSRDKFEKYQPSKVAEQHLILIDGSWRQAYAIWHSNPWLHALNAYHFANPPRRNYDIRASKNDTQLSTIEALSYSLEVLYRIDTTPLESALVGLKQQWFTYAKN